MTHSLPSPGTVDGSIRTKVSDAAVRRLAEAIAHLNNDGEYFVAALADALLAMSPITKDRLTEQQERFLVESGTFTSEELAETIRRVDRGTLQLRVAETWLSHLCATLSLDDVTGYLAWDEVAVRVAVSEGRLYAVEISGQLRFPHWQFDVGSPQKLLPGLAEVIEAVSSRWSAGSVAAFMATPQEDLIAKGPKTPAAWLRDGGSVGVVKEIVESDDWR